MCLLSAHAQQSPSPVSSRAKSPSPVSLLVNKILSEFTVDQELSYIGGTGFFDFKPIPVNDFSPLDPQLYQTDGPLGVRRNEPSIRFPSGLTLAATWNPQRGEIIQGLQAYYYTTPDLSGQAAVSRVDNQINFDWDIDQIPVSSNQGSFSAKWVGQIKPTITGDHVIKVRGDGGLRIILNGTTIFDNFNSPTTPPVGYGPTPAYSAKVTLTAGQTYNIEIDYRRVGGFFDTFEQGGLTGIQASWAALKPPSTIAGYNAVIIAAGISNEYEGEGEDREFTLPEFQDELIKNVSAANPQTVVVFHGGGNFDSEQWINQVAGLIEAFYPGQLGGQALAEILFGDVNPSGKLPITMEKRIQDNPAFKTFPEPVNQHPDSITYREGIFVGYRGYEHNQVQPLFPFGFGLSYTTFSFSNLNISGNFSAAPVTVKFTVTNTGSVAGAEVAQLYVGEQNAPVPRPVKELKGFQKVFLSPGQSTKLAPGVFFQSCSIGVIKFGGARLPKGRDISPEKITHPDSLDSVRSITRRAVVTRWATARRVYRHNGSTRLVYADCP